MKCVALISGGKDSWFNAMHCVANRHEIVALANLRPQPLLPDELDSFMYQTVGHDAIHLQAECLSIPLYREYITGESIDQTLNYTITTNDETEDLYRLLAHVKSLHPEIQGVSVGAILSTYQRARVENVCSRLGLTCLAYLWQRDQKELLSEMIQSRLTAVIIKVAAIGIKTSVQELTIGLKSLHLGKTLGELQPTLLKLNERFEIHVCGEGGEYETFVVDCPLWSRKIVMDACEIVDHSSGDVAYLRISAHTESKTAPTDALVLSPPPILEEHFRDIYNNISKIPLPPDASTNETICTNFTDTPKIIQIGDGVYASDSIAAPSSSSIEQDSRFCLDTLICIIPYNLTNEALLRQYDLSIQHIISITLLLKDMSDFTIVNPIYASYFTFSLPPSRVTISTSIPENVRLSAIISTRPRTGLHVQSRSYWAPANIGPYSQSISYDDSTFLAGQIGLIPGTMEFPVPRSTAMESVLSLQHIFRVSRAVKVDPEVGIEGAVVYIADESDVGIVKELWKTAFDVAPPLAIVVVDGLPRGAKVEWHIIRCQRTSEDAKKGKFRMTFEEHEVITAIAEFRDPNGVLCLTFGSSKQHLSIRSKYNDVAIQSIPSKAVFSISGDKVERHPSCTIILSE